MCSIDVSEIIRMLYTEFDELIPEEKRGITFYPQKFAKEIDGINDWVYDTVNNGLPLTFRKYLTK
jgi:glutathionyl-hydroquinone reductase